MTLSFQTPLNSKFSEQVHLVAKSHVRGRSGFSTTDFHESPHSSSGKLNIDSLFPDEDNKEKKDQNLFQKKEKTSYSRLWKMNILKFS